jgi:hypothetical protein
MIKSRQAGGVLTPPPFFASVPEATNGKPLRKQIEAKNALRSFSEEGLHLRESQLF